MFLTFLKYINSLPFPLTVKHYYPFDLEKENLKNQELNSPESWDELRESNPHFSISTNREEWLMASENKVKKDGQDGGLIQRAGDVVKILVRENINSVFSVGVGGAGLEYQIKKMKPEIEMVCSEYAPKSVDLLKRVFIEANSIVLFDIKNGNWESVFERKQEKNNLVLMYRIDINFSDEEMRKIFKDMSFAKVDKILIILCGRITARGIFNRSKDRFIGMLKGQKYVFRGFLGLKKRSLVFGTIFIIMNQLFALVYLGFF